MPISLWQSSCIYYKKQTTINSGLEDCSLLRTLAPKGAYTVFVITAVSWNSPLFTSEKKTGASLLWQRLLGLLLAPVRSSDPRNNCGTQFGSTMEVKSLGTFPVIIVKLVTPPLPPKTKLNLEQNGWKLVFFWATTLLGGGEWGVGSEGMRG